jgi:hypothetical protein
LGQQGEEPYRVYRKQERKAGSGERKRRSGPYKGQERKQRPMGMAVVGGITMGRRALKKGSWYPPISPHCVTTQKTAIDLISMTFRETETLEIQYKLKARCV